MKGIKGKQENFFGLLVRNYIGFTLAILIVVLSTVGYSYLKINRIWDSPDISKVIEYQKELTSGQYDKIPVERLLGAHSSIECVDDSGKVVYSSRGETGLRYTKEEISYIPDYNREVYVEEMEFLDPNGAKRFLVTTMDFQQGTYQAKSYVILDQEHRILVTNEPGIQGTLTDREYGFLSGKLPEDTDIKKYAFTDQAGNKKVLLIHTPKVTDELLNKAFDRMEYSAAVFLMLYIALIGAFVIWLNRKVKKPMSLLNDAILSVAEGKSTGQIQYTGPREFEQICDSFNLMSRQLEESEAKRRKLQADKQKMLADISHDLKTPITVIQGFSKAIYDGLVYGEKKKQYLNAIYYKSTALTELINTFYEYSKLEHPEFKLHAELTELCEYVREYLAQKYDEIEVSEFLLEVDIPEEEIWCSIDHLQLKRVFENIMENCLKHNKKGTTLFFAVKREAEEAVITIGDNGVGISGSLRGSIFEPFVVGDNSRNNRQGSGLGLAIGQKIVQAHSGSIQLVSPPDKGYSTQFEIRVPMEIER